MDTDENLRRSSAADRQRVIIRDDQMDFARLLDLIRERRRNDLRLGLVDSGVFDPFQMEWLAEAGADIYTSNRARQDLSAVIMIGRAAKRGNAITAYFHRGALASEEKSGPSSFAELGEMGRSGIDIHLSNKLGPLQWPKLEDLAESCQSGGARLVVYFHGPLAVELESLARRGAWVHVSDASLRGSEDISLLTDCAASARAHGARVIFHLEHPLPLDWLEDIFAADVSVLFKIPPTDYRSPLRPFERASKKCPPDFRASYIDATFLP